MAGAAVLSTRNERRFRRPPPLPPDRAPRLRVRLAVARVGEHDPELVAIEEAAVAALGEIALLRQRSERMGNRLSRLRDTLEALQARAARRHLEEDQYLGGPYERACRALWQAPVDLDAAGRSVARYEAEVDHRIGDLDKDEGMGEETGHG